MKKNQTEGIKKQLEHAQSAKKDHKQEVHKEMEKVNVQLQEYERFKLEEKFKKEQ